MLHHEFEALIGRKATDEEYTRANGIYMNINMTKEKFCEEWEAVKDSKILKELRQCQADWKMISEHKTTLMKSAGHAILGNINDYGFKQDLENAAANLLDRKEIVTYRLKNGFELTKDDTDYILNRL